MSLNKHQDVNQDVNSCAAWIAKFLKAQGIDRVFGLQGSYLQPLWDHIGRTGIQIVDVRDEDAAVYMAHAHAELTGQIGVALATAGPGVTNTVTAMANAFVSRVPVLLIGGCPSQQQSNMGPLQDIPHVDILKPVTRYSRTARIADHVVREFNEAFACAAGYVREPGPAYIEVPTDVLRTPILPQLILDDWMQPTPRRPMYPDPVATREAMEVFWAAKRPVVITGRGAKGAGDAIVRLLEATGALYLDTQESRGVVPYDHPASVGAARSQVMTDADVVLLVGRKLDYQLGYGSPAVFPHARFIRIADAPGELFDNRRGRPEILASARETIESMLSLADGRSAAVDVSWAANVRDRHLSRVARAAALEQRETLGSDGKIHPRVIFDAIAEVAFQDYIGVADGGDLLSFARTGLQSNTYMDSGAFGCLGAGVPFAIAAALAQPGRQVISVNGDGAFGINAMEIDTAVRHGAKVVFIVSNNAAWNLERIDQEMNYGGRVVGTTLRHSDYAGLARSLGAHGERVEKPEDMVGALERALANAPALIDVVTSQSVVSSDMQKGLSLVPDYQALMAWDEAERRRRQ
ncbi:MULTISPECIES: thiamine pyrophosphate-binding protein [Cupriavidus]|uniref:Thiamine pyrophosphate-binding protein n=1 Tax=Cupriavidus basilensis TaxID=68895 RepID=A0A643G0N5_9BURK|nr:MULTISPECIES: thiamine pyrophosphate-binding protein [Cupriavidus]KUE88042.1 acetolactate synthase [Cupriavidus necator]NOV23820.1 thiamine pyrophosphate-binding protein [Cupriavidus necator]QOT81867.1 thiamine pyrophosphate-binding protein [Cupriavidus basilensis]BDB30271.1 thiamine pyrophosphate-binding protein [Cupriavidus sp. P-10]